MKMIIIFFALFLGFNVFAGPEERKEAQICYVTEARRLPSDIPLEVCLEELSINQVRKEIKVESYFFSKFYRGLKLVEFKRERGNTHSFTATNIIEEDKGRPCGHGENVTLILSGTVGPNRKVDLRKLKVSVVRSYWMDKCRLPAKEQIFEYKLR